MIKFAWDENKNEINIKKHGINFVEAYSVFFDEEALLLYDPDHSINEDRWILLGLSSSLKILVVVHIYSKNDLIRIISARKATKNEEKQYLLRKGKL